MKGDRFEKIVEDTFGPTQTLLRGEAIALLRKEYAEVRRMVIKYLKLNYHGKLPKYEGTPVHGYRTACNDILAALDKRAKGGRK